MPFRCTFCQNQHDLVDTQVELIGGLHGYICRNCVRAAAQKMNYVGKGADRIETLTSQADVAEKERDQYKTERDEAQKELLSTQFELENAQKENANLRGRVAQLQSRIAEEARAALELVGGDAA